MLDLAELDGYFTFLCCLLETKMNLERRGENQFLCCTVVTTTCMDMWRFPSPNNSFSTREGSCTLTLKFTVLSSLRKLDRGPPTALHVGVSYFVSEAPFFLPSIAHSSLILHKVFYIRFRCHLKS